MATLAQWPAAVIEASLSRLQAGVSGQPRRSQRTYRRRPLTNETWPHSRSRLPRGVTSSRWARVGVQPLRGRNCWPQGQSGSEATLDRLAAHPGLATRLFRLLRSALRSRVLTGCSRQPTGWATAKRATAMRRSRRFSRSSAARARSATPAVRRRQRVVRRQCDRRVRRLRPPLPRRSNQLQRSFEDTLFSGEASSCCSKA